MTGCALLGGVMMLLGPLMAAGEAAPRLALPPVRTMLMSDNAAIDSGRAGPTSAAGRSTSPPGRAGRLLTHAKPANLAEFDALPSPLLGVAGRSAAAEPIRRRAVMVGRDPHLPAARPLSVRDTVDSATIIDRIAISQAMVEGARPYYRRSMLSAMIVVDMDLGTSAKPRVGMGGGAAAVWQAAARIRRSAAAQ